MNTQKILSSVLILILFASNLYFVSNLVSAQQEIEGHKAALELEQRRKPFAQFHRLFVEKVLQAEGEVSFEARLDLENKVRDLGDAVILDQWNSFVNAETQEEAQEQVKKLLGLLAERMEK